MRDCAYITMLGRSLWALVNSYYAVLRERGIRPKEIRLLAEKPYEGDVSKAEGAIRVLSEEFGLNPSISHAIVGEGDFFGAGLEVKKLVTTFKSRGFEVALDITPGRKALVAGSLLSLSNVDIDHVYYLKIKSLENSSRPYMMIPLNYQELSDFVADRKGRGDR
ncbi:MAG: hypothetical protein NO516_00960 [Candidatus Methanomethylicia archaeon]|nr:hypothetical protein [Candidatus Methanomethylicia archaeon]